MANRDLRDTSEVIPKNLEVIGPTSTYAESMRAFCETSQQIFPRAVVFEQAEQRQDWLFGKEGKERKDIENFTASRSTVIRSLKSSNRHIYILQCGASGGRNGCGELDMGPSAHCVVLYDLDHEGARSLLLYEPHKRMRRVERVSELAPNGVVKLQRAFKSRPFFYMEGSGRSSDLDCIQRCLTHLREGKEASALIAEGLARKLSR